ncbi:hypothetical protein [Streptomyces sp. NPDC059009]|uniref:hypothetical protein n=1 Tax=Streptomyces sp. NPDC059009 TaxID=3346694 RepID=UPI0036CB65DC
MAIGKDWSLTALSPLVKVGAKGGTVKQDTKPVHTLTAKVSGTSKTGPSTKDVLASLEKELSWKHLARPGTRTTSAPAVLWQNEFDGKAQSAAYVGHHTVTADYRYTCGKTTAKGRVVTWAQQSTHSGGINCLEPRTDQIDTGEDSDVLAEQAIAERCAKNSPARKAA